MELSRKRVGIWGRAAGLTGAMLIACMACCLPLMAPLLAWLGVAGLALMGPYGMLAAASVVGAILSVVMMRRRRRAQKIEADPSACKTCCR